MSPPKPLHWEQHGQLCILSIDDDQVNLMVIEQLLAPQGWKIISACDGDEALDTLADEPCWPDAVLLDYTLANETGDQVCRRLRDVFGTMQVPIIMCTALTAGHDALQECMTAGATDYILKPYDQTQIVKKIHQYCASKTTAKPPAAAAAPAPTSAAASAPAPAASTSATTETIESFCTRIDLEYCGKKLEAAGFTLLSLKTADDAALRKAGIVVKAQRDKLLEAAKALY